MRQYRAVHQHHPGSPGQRAVKLVLLLLVYFTTHVFISCMVYGACEVHHRVFDTVMHIILLLMCCLYCVLFAVNLTTLNNETGKNLKNLQ